MQYVSFTKGQLISKRHFEINWPLAMIFFSFSRTYFFLWKKRLILRRYSRSVSSSKKWVKPLSHDVSTKVKKWGTVISNLVLRMGPKLKYLQILIHLYICLIFGTKIVTGKGILQNRKNIGNNDFKDLQHIIEYVSLNL